MAKTKAQIIAEAQVVKNATEVGENTATRVGTVLEDLASDGTTFSTGEFIGDVGIDATPTQGSDNLVKSGGVWSEVNEVVPIVPEVKLGWIISWQGKLMRVGTAYRFVTFIAPKEMDVSVTYLNSNSYENNGKLFVLPSINNLVADYIATILHSFVKDVEGTYSVHLQEGNVLCVSNMSGDTYSFSSSVTLKEKMSELQGGKVNLISPTSIMPNEGASVYVYNTGYNGTIIGQTYRNKTASAQSFNVIRVGLRCTITDAVLRAFKVPSIYWTGSNYSLPTMANLELLYEGAYYNSGSGRVNDYQIILPNIVELAQNDSIFAVVFGSARVISVPLSRVTSQDGTNGYFSVFSNPTYPYNYETITLSVGRGDYCCIPPTMELLPIYATLNEYTKDVRPRIDIYTSDTEIEILEKMIKAGTIGNADVYWETGTYTFSEVYIYMRDTLRWSWHMGLPIGNGCRYYLNGSTIISNAPAETYSDTRFAFDTRMKGDLEMYDGTIIGNNATYCIHDEMGNPFFPDAYIHKYKNIVFEYTGAIHPFGAGVNFNSRYVFENCIFKSDISGNFHGPTNSDNLPVHFELTIIGCYFQRSPLGATSQFDSTRDEIRLIYANNSAKSAIFTAANSIVEYLNEIRP